jgi:phosphoribosylaminoimidazole carboxylase PurE protein
VSRRWTGVVRYKALAREGSTMSKVVLLIGSMSDRKIVKDSKMFDVFDHVGVKVDIHVMSAHRNAEELHRFCGTETEARIYIAAAALATALPGAIAGATRMRKVVIGVPLDDYGVDSCLRMPPGVPVLTAGVGKAGLHNAAIAACQILAVDDADVATRLDLYLSENARSVHRDVTLDDV